MVVLTTRKYRSNDVMGVVDILGDINASDCREATQKVARFLEFEDK